MNGITWRKECPNHECHQVVDFDKVLNPNNKDDVVLSRVSDSIRWLARTDDKGHHEVNPMKQIEVVTEGWQKARITSSWKNPLPLDCSIGRIIHGVCVGGWNLLFFLAKLFMSMCRNLSSKLKNDFCNTWLIYTRLQGGNEDALLVSDKMPQWEAISERSFDDK